MKARIVSKRIIAENTLAVELEPEQKVSFKAGQYLVLNLLKPRHLDGRGSIRIFSITSRPEDHIITIATRLSESAFKRSLKDAEIGDEVEIKYIGGKFTLPAADRKIVMVAGGIGIAPFISMLRLAWSQDKGYDITLFYSNRTIVSAAFLDELKELDKKNPKFHLVLTYTRQKGWRGECERIDEGFVKRYVEDPLNNIFMVVGPSDMVNDVSDLLMDMGVPREQVLSESFTGN